MRLYHALGMTAEAQSHARALIGYLDRIGATTVAPWRLEAGIIALDVNDQAGRDALRKALTTVAVWPLAQRLQRMLDARSEP
jgi:hypothetical protein